MNDVHLAIQFRILQSNVERSHECCGHRRLPHSKCNYMSISSHDFPQRHSRKYDFNQTKACGWSMSVLAVMYALMAGLCANAEETEITILHTNDLHQNLEPLPRIAGYVAHYKQQHPNTVFVDAGDWFDRGSSLVMLTRGDTLYGAMQRMGYDMWIVGNHDWAYGGERLIDLIMRCPVPVLATNLGTTRTSLPDNIVRTVVRDFDGIRVGFFGITLDTYGTNPKSRPNLYVLNCQTETEKAIEELKREGVDLIVAVTHLGFEKMKHEVGRSKHPSDQDLARNNPDIDIVIGGHSHTLLEEPTVRAVYARTGAIITQAGASGRHVGRLTLTVDKSDDARAKINRFDVENVPILSLMPIHTDVAVYLERQYAQHMPHAQTVVGEFQEPMEFHNLAFWYADFLKKETGADICLLPRKTLYDEPSSYAAGEVDVERLLGYLYDRHIIKATVRGSDLLAYCDTKLMRDRFHPHHHRGRPFSGDAVFYSGFDVVFQPATQVVDFSIDPSTDYTIAIPWPYTEADIRAYRYELPPRSDAQQADHVPGLRLTHVQLHPHTSRQLLVGKGKTDGLDFYVKFAKPRDDWIPWRKHFEADVNTAK